MLVSVSGGRTYNDFYKVCEIMNHYAPWITHVNHGGAKGLDTMVENWCIINGIPSTIYLPQYQHANDREAPKRRNIELIRGTAFLLAFPTSQSRGTYHAISVAEKMGIKVYKHDI